MKVENKNFILNVAYQILTYVFPLITVSYVSKNLGVNNIGIYSYTYSIVYMFMLVGLLGINNYGNRAIAKVRDSKEKLSKEFLSIYQLQVLVGICVLIGYIFYLIFFCHKYKNIATIQILQLISILFDINWFYFGLEKFKLVIARNFIIKIVSVIFIFFFVKNNNDLWKYTLIMASSILVSQLYLVYCLKKYVIFVKCSFIESIKHFKGILILFIPVLAFGIYRIMDKTMIGFLSSVVELGYYENAERLVNIPISLINALGVVMLPRMSYLLEDDNFDYKKPIFESMKLALLMSTIMSGGLFLISDNICIILFGKEFFKSGEILKIISITIVASAWSNVIRTQYLIPKSLDKVYISSTIGGAIVNLFLNVLLIKKYGAYGACVGTIVAEYFVAFYQTFKVRKYIEIDKYLFILVINFFKALVIIAIAYVVGVYFKSIYLRTAVNIIVAILGFFIFNYKYILYEFLGFNKK